MSNELVRSNHKPTLQASPSPDAEFAAMFAASDVLSRAGLATHLIATGEALERLNRDVAEARRFRAIADERFLLGAEGRADSTPPRLWNVPMMAKQLGVSADVVRRRARKWSFALCVTHDACHGGNRGCDLRFRAAEAATWVNAQRRQGVRR